MLLDLGPLAVGADRCVDAVGGVVDVRNPHAVTPMNSSRHLIRGARSCVLALVVVHAACTVGPNFVRPSAQTPAHWSDRPAPVAPDPIAATPSGPSPQPSTVTEQTADLSAWWDGFDDQRLSSLIERALSANLDLRTAVLRVDEARAQRAIAAAAYWPTLALDDSFTRQRFSVTTPTGALFS